MIKCSNCNAENTDVAKFCSSCGSKLEMHCLACNAYLESNAKFCPECGTRVSALKTQTGTKAVAISLNSEIEKIDVNVASAVVTGPDEDGDCYVEVEMEVNNCSDVTISFFAVHTQLYNHQGMIVGDTDDAYEEELKAGSSTRFSTSLWGINKKLLGGPSESSKIVVSVLCGSGAKNEIYSGKVVGDVQRPSAFVGHESTTGVRFVSGSYKSTSPDEDNNIDFELSVLLQNLEKTYFPRAKLYVELNDKHGELIVANEDYQDLKPNALAYITLSTRLNKEALENAEVKVYLETFEQCAVGLGESGSIQFKASDNKPSNTSDDSTLKTIYVKTEPGGRVIFGRLTDDDQNSLEHAIIEKEMPESLLELTHNSSGDFREYEGVFNQGEAGDYGNEGIISYDSDGPIAIPKDKHGRYIDGAYLVYLSFSKVSIEFQFEPSGGQFESEKLTEVSVPIRLPDCIEHETYGHPAGNVVIDYLYDGEPIEEYTRELVDRGYDDQTSFLIVKGDKIQLAYTSFNGVESWPDGMDLNTNAGGNTEVGSNLSESYSQEFEEIAQSKGVFVKGNIPEKKLQNAIEAYANGVAPDDVLLLVDDTVFGSAKEGMLMTSDAIYGHQLAAKPVKVSYSNITSADTENERLGCYLRLNELRFILIATVDKQVVAKIASLIEKCASRITNK